MGYIVTAYAWVFSDTFSLLEDISPFFLHYFWPWTAIGQFATRWCPTTRKGFRWTKCSSTSDCGSPSSQTTWKWWTPCSADSRSTNYSKRITFRGRKRSCATGAIQTCNSRRRRIAGFTKLETIFRTKCWIAPYTNTSFQLENISKYWFNHSTYFS